MIHPNMATMLGFILTDLDIEKEALELAFSSATAHSFNAISVDGDMSTNDTVVMLANGEARNSNLVAVNTPDFTSFQAHLTRLCIELAQLIVRGGGREVVVDDVKMVRVQRNS